MNWSFLLILAKGTYRFIADRREHRESLFAKQEINIHVSEKKYEKSVNILFSYGNNLVAYSL